MTRSSADRIADIVDACEEVAEVVRLRGQGGLPDLVLTRAVERLLEVIGEASTALTEEARDAYPSIPWREIMRLRIILAHHYQRIDPRQVWTIATEEIPRLAVALRANRVLDTP